MRKKIIVKGPFRSRSGYGEQARFALRALRSREDIFDIYALDIPWGSTGNVSEDTAEKNWIDFLVQKTINHTQGQGAPFDMTLQVTIPGEFEVGGAPYNVGYTAGAETNIVSAQWLQKINQMNRIITTSEHTKKSILNSSYNITDTQTGQDKGLLMAQPHIEAVNYPVKKIKPKKVDLELKHDFNFLIVAQWCPRKNLENTISWFVEEFRDDEVGLVIKTNTAKNSTMDHDFTTRKLDNLLTSLGERTCSVYLLHGDMTDEELTGLYIHDQIKAMVSLTHGEGFGLPLFEAAYNGLPIIAPGWSGHIDFLSAPVKGKVIEHYTVVEHEVAPIHPEAVWPGVLEAASQWCYPDKKSYKRGLRDIFKNYKDKIKMSKRLKGYILRNWEEKKIYKTFVEALGIELDTSPEESTDEEVLVFD